MIYIFSITYPKKPSKGGYCRTIFMVIRWTITTVLPLYGPSSQLSTVLWLATPTSVMSRLDSARDHTRLTRPARLWSVQNKNSCRRRRVFVGRPSDIIWSDAFSTKATRRALPRNKATYMRRTRPPTTVLTLNRVGIDKLTFTNNFFKYIGWYIIYKSIHVLCR